MPKTQMQIGSQISDHDFLKQVIQYALQHEILTQKRIEELTIRAVTIWQSLMQQWHLPQSETNLPTKLNFNNPSHVQLACQIIEKTISMGLTKTSGRNLAQAAEILRDSDLLLLFKHISVCIKNLREKTFSTITKSFFAFSLPDGTDIAILKIPLTLLNTLIIHYQKLNLAEITSLAQLQTIKSDLNQAQLFIAFSQKLPWQKLFTQLGAQEDMEIKQQATQALEKSESAITTSIGPEIDPIALIITLTFTELITGYAQTTMSQHQYLQDRPDKKQRKALLRKCLQFIQQLDPAPELLKKLKPYFQNTIANLGPQQKQTPGYFDELRRSIILIATTDTPQENMALARKFANDLDPEEKESAFISMEDPAVKTAILEQFTLSQILKYLEYICALDFKQLPTNPFLKWNWPKIDWFWIEEFISDSQYVSLAFNTAFLQALLKQGSSQLWKETSPLAFKTIQHLIRPEMPPELSEQLFCKITPRERDVCDQARNDLSKIMIHWASLYPETWQILYLEAGERPHNIKKINAFIQEQPDDRKTKLEQLVEKVKEIFRET